MGTRRLGPAVGLRGQVGVSLRSRAALYKCSASGGGDGSEGGEVRVGLELGVVGAGWGL